MGFFKKKVQPVAVERKCPAEGCVFTVYDEIALKKHIEWKHPELKGNSEEKAVKVK
jgi:hypothetical protein